MCVCARARALLRVICAAAGRKYVASVVLHFSYGLVYQVPVCVWVIHDGRALAYQMGTTAAQSGRIQKPSNDEMVFFFCNQIHFNIIKKSF